MFPRLLLLAFLGIASFAQAGTQRFEASTLKYLYSISLDQKKDAVKGTFTRSEYGVNKAKYDFKAKWVSLPKGTKGQGLKVSFAKSDLKKKGNPYPFPSNQGTPVWRLVQSKGSTRIYVWMVSKVYSMPPRWKTAELVFDRS